MWLGGIRIACTEPLTVITRAMRPFFVALFIVPMMVTYLPWLSLRPPRTMGL